MRHLKNNFLECLKHVLIIIRKIDMVCKLKKAKRRSSMAHKVRVNIDTMDLKIQRNTSVPGFKLFVLHQTTRGM